MGYVCENARIWKVMSSLVAILELRRCSWSSEGCGWVMYVTMHGLGCP